MLRKHLWHAFQVKISRHPFTCAVTSQMTGYHGLCMWPQAKQGNQPSSTQEHLHESISPIVVHQPGAWGGTHLKVEEQQRHFQQVAVSKSSFLTWIRYYGVVRALTLAV